LIGDPLLWPTRARVRDWLEEAGFELESQHRIHRRIAGRVFPPVLTSARKTSTA
jgi:hypothetical protein